MLEIVDINNDLGPEREFIERLFDIGNQEKFGKNQ